MLATDQSTVLSKSVSVLHVHGVSVLHVNGVMLQVKLLQFVRPQDFDNFKHFVRWRDTTANILLQILQRAAQVPASEDDKYGCWLALTCRMPLFIFWQCMLVWSHAYVGCINFRHMHLVVACCELVHVSV